MNDALNRFNDSFDVMQISGYFYPVNSPDKTGSSFMTFSNPWGWATWQHAWMHFDTKVSEWSECLNEISLRRRFDLNDSFDFSGQLSDFVEGRTSAWDIFWYVSIFRRNALVLYPHISLVNNIGFDGSGEHCPTSDIA